MSSEVDRRNNGSAAGRHTVERRSLTSVLTRQQHIAEVAKRYAGTPMTTLSHHMDEYFLREAFSRLNKDSAKGCDGVSVKEYGKELNKHLPDLLERAKSGRFKAPPVKRAFIPKNEKEQRPIGIPTTESKLLERAVVMLLEPVYENDFYDCSYGFRPNRSPHKALDALRESLVRMKGGWILDVDIRKYFDTIPHAPLREILRKRVKDKVILRLIGKWLKAGVQHEDVVTYSEEGTPQGGVISPLLSNIYLHEVLDAWYMEEVKPLLRGKSDLIRYADDFVMVFEQREDALRVWRVIGKRFRKYGLELHPDKTRLVNFLHPWEGKGKPETFDFLGFTHYWKKTRRNGFSVTKKTSGKKFKKSLRAVWDWCKKNRHLSMRDQHQEILKKLRGHLSFYSVTGNFRALMRFKHKMLEIWRYWLNRRSRKKDGMKKRRFYLLISSVFQIPPVKIVHLAVKPRQMILNF